MFKFMKPDASYKHKPNFYHFKRLPGTHVTCFHSYISNYCFIFLVEYKIHM
jgi:hypothetical protein